MKASVGGMRNLPEDCWAVGPLHDQDPPRTVFLRCLCGRSLSIKVNSGHCKSPRPRPREHDP